MKLSIYFASLALWVIAQGCTHKVQIEPSDKPFIVNLNLKVDHEIKMQIEEENSDLINLEKNITKKRGG